MDSEVVTTAPARLSRSSATGISCLLQDDTPSARIYTAKPARKRDKVVCRTQTWDYGTLSESAWLIGFEIGGRGRKTDKDDADLDTDDDGCVELLFFDDRLDGGDGH